MDYSDMLGKMMADLAKTGARYDCGELSEVELAREMVVRMLQGFGRCISEFSEDIMDRDATECRQLSDIMRAFADWIDTHASDLECRNGKE